MKEIISAIFASYIITAVLVNGSIFYSAREWIKARTPWLVKGAPGKRRHLVDCRLCVDFWVSILVYVLFTTRYPLPTILLIYGASYFLATQER